LPRKTRQTQPQEQLSERELYDVLEFARNIYNNNIIPNVYTPDLINARMKDMNLNPLAATETDIENALKDPKNNEFKLIGFSEFFTLTSMIYKRLVGYISQMPSFDYTFTCTNITSKEEYKSKKYKKDLQKVYEFLDRFDVKREFKKITNQLLTNEIYYGVLRDDSDFKYIFQELPYSYCKITGRSEFSLLFDFNMMYFFNQVGISLDMYPPAFKEYYNRILDSKNNGYNPANSIDKRTGEWVYWVQTSPEQNMFAFKFNPESITAVPYLAPLFSDVVLAPLTRSLQKNINILKAQKVIVGLIPLLKEIKGGSVKDAIAIDSITLGKFLGLLKAGLHESVKIGGVPFSDIKEIDFDTTNTNIFDDYSKTTAAMSGINSRMVFANDKMSNSETIASINVDEFLATHVYHQFNQFMDYQINKKTSHYRFKFKFEGTEFQSNRQFRLDNALKLSEKGITLPQKIAAAMGIEIPDFYRQLEECQAMEFYSMLTPLISVYQQGKDDKGGRERKPDNELSDLGEAGRDAGSNIGRGGKI
jgi:hypothetical protein